MGIALTSLTVVPVQLATTFPAAPLQDPRKVVGVVVAVGLALVGVIVGLAVEVGWVFVGVWLGVGAVLGGGVGVAEREIAGPGVIEIGCPTWVPAEEITPQVTVEAPATVASQITAITSG